MSDHDGRVRAPIEEAAGDQAERMRSRLDSKRPRRADQLTPSFIDSLLAGQRVSRMQVEGDVERGEPFPERKKLRLVVVRGCVEVADARVAVDERALEPVIADGAFELARGGLGILHGQGRECGVPIGTARDDGGQRVVGRSRALDGSRDVELILHAGPAE
jgi:hypothetical protein